MLLFCTSYLSKNPNEQKVVQNTAVHHRNKLHFKTFFRITDKVLAFDLLSILILDKLYMSL